MSYKNINLYCHHNLIGRLNEVTNSPEVIAVHQLPQDENSTMYTFLVNGDNVQTLTDRIQNIIGDNSQYSLQVITVDTVIPKPQDVAETTKKALSEPDEKKFLGVSREELLEIVSKGIVLDANFFYLVFFSTIVAAIGLLEDNLAVVIGAMVIAPLLGPNLALAFSAALGNIPLMQKSIKTNLAGFSTCLALAILIGMVWPYEYESEELQIRTDVSFDGVILAIVSGAAAVLSLTKGISSVMVGVMVAVALLPPATTLGIMIGAGNYPEAYGALLLLAVNIVCVNLAAMATLLLKGIRPRTWYEQETAKYALRWFLLFWVLALVVLLVVIYLKETYPELPV